MAQHIVALDLGASYAHVAIIAATFRRAQLLRVFSIPREADEPTAAIMARVREATGVRIDNFVCGLDARQASVHTMQFPFGDSRRAAAAVEFELEGRVPFDMDQVMVCWRTIRQTPRSMQVLAAVTPRAPLAAQLQDMATAGLEPRAVVHPAAALHELMRREPEAQTGAEHAAAALCLTATQAHLCVVQGGLRFVRSLRAGGDAIERALMHNLEIDAEQARAILSGPAVLLSGEALAQASPEARRLHAAMVTALDPLVGGLFTTFKTLEPAERPHRILLTGGAAQIAGLDEFLQAKIGIRVGHLELGAALGPLTTSPNRPAPAPAHALVLAMAMALFRHGQDVPLNFRHGALAYHGDLQLYRGQLVRVAAALMGIFLLAGVHAGVRYGMLRAEEREVSQAFCTTTERITGHAICDPTAALATLRQTDGGGIAIPSYSATAMLEMISRRLPSTLKVQFDELDVRVDAVPGQPDRLTGRGEVADFNGIEEVVSLLRADPCVQDAEVSKQRKSGSGQVEFSLSVKVACPAGQLPGRSPLPRAAGAPQGASL